MEVRPERTSHAAALEARASVVSIPCDDATERFRPEVEHRPSGVVLESRDRLSGRLGQRAREEDVADHPRLPGQGLVREEPGPGHPGAVAPAVAPAEQLVAAADREQRGPAVDRGAEVVASYGEVGGDQRLLAILAAADVEKVVHAGLEGVPRVTGSSSSSWPRAPARRWSTAMLPRSA